jgi:cell division protein FtsN
MVPPNGDNRDAPFQASTEESAYHQNWPIMVEETGSNKRGKGFLILILLVVLAGSAVAGFVLFKDRVFRARNIPNTGSSANNAVRGGATEPKPRDAREDPRSAASPAAAQGGGKPVSPGPGQSPEVTSPSPAATVAGRVDAGKAPQTTQAGDASGARVTLQAASFPSEASAKQFQDRLVQAGLPAYVVAADIPHRGKWYRVRAGKFSSQDEARKAAETWRKRMAAAGINTQLVPCDSQ